MRRRSLVIGIPVLMAFPLKPAWAQERTFSGVVIFDRKIELPSGSKIAVFVGESSLQHGTFASDIAPIANTHRPWQFSLQVDGLSGSRIVSVFVTVSTDDKSYFYGGAVGSVADLTSRSIPIEMQWDADRGN